ncbi:MAG: arsenic resistance N-acetyltransferase ArsN2 [Gemmatimonadaceae bacterium]
MRGASEPTAAAKLRPANAADLVSVEQLLEENGLPRDGVREALDDFIVAELGGQVVGAIGLEVYGNCALLRSAVVKDTERGTGLGARLVDGILERAGGHSVQSVYLLTTTAEDYFPRFGFAPTARDEVPSQLNQSVEFRGACPDTAVVMVRAIV